MKIFRIFLLGAIIFSTGCASISKGIAEAVIEKSKKEANTGECTIFSAGFDGIEDIMRENNNKVKIMMVHGIGQKLPGYSMSLVNTLAIKLGLDVRERNSVNIKLESKLLPNKDLGNLRIYRLTSKSNDRELLFYEYTWSSITEEVKSYLKFDYTDTNATKRTDLAKLLKSFVNETGADAFIYLGNREVYEQIALGMLKASCFMTLESWDNLSAGKTECDATKLFGKDLESNFLFITHSLGSQIAIDLFHFVISTSKNDHQEFNDTKNAKVKIFMFANQLPAISLGKKKPDVAGKIKNYCAPSGDMYKYRFLDKLEIIAFSDPNDVLSYAIPSNFEDTNIDSRLCPETTNVIVNVAPLADIFGSNIANPLTAHSNYQNDERVLKLLIEGVNAEDDTINTKEGCLHIKFQ